MHPPSPLFPARRSIVDDSGKLTALLQQTVDALSELHLAGFVHRDIQPDSFLVQHHYGRGIRVCIAGFGAAMPLGEAAR